ncbi:MAG: hypothetical protein V1682_05765 [Candidatus Omnitrophota bacterium]
MKIKYLAMALAAALVVAAVLLILRPSLTGRQFSDKLPGSKQVPGRASAAKKTFAKNMGGLNVRTLNVRNRPDVLRIKAFKSDGANSSVHVRTFTSGKAQELEPGTYDIEVDTMPQKIFKGIKVTAGEEAIKDLDYITGNLNVKISNFKKGPASFPVNVYYPKTDIKIATTVANRPLELLAGTYDVEIGILPKIREAAVTVEAGKEKTLELGVLTGALMVKAVDQNKALKSGARQSVKVRRADTNALVINTRVNRTVELGPGRYDVDIDTVPPQVSKDVKIETGKETVVEAIVQAPFNANSGKK